MLFWYLLVVIKINITGQKLMKSTGRWTWCRRWTYTRQGTDEARRRKVREKKSVLVLASGLELRRCWIVSSILYKFCGIFIRCTEFSIEDFQWQSCWCASYLTWYWISTQRGQSAYSWFPQNSTDVASVMTASTRLSLKIGRVRITWLRFDVTHESMKSGCNLYHRLLCNLKPQPSTCISDPALRLERLTINFVLDYLVLI